VPQTAVDNGYGIIAADFIESFCRITKDSVAGVTGTPLLLRSWQRQLLSQLLAKGDAGGLRHRQALIGMPRKNGKSALLSSLSLYFTFYGVDGGETYAVASSKDQARIVFGDAKRMVTMEPELAERVKVYKDTIEVVETGSVMRVLAAEAGTLEGLNASACVYDEVHTAPNDDLWNVMQLSMAARPVGAPIMIGITTAGSRTDASGRDSLAFRMYEYGKRVASGEVIDDSFFFAWWEPDDPDADHRDPKVWTQSNPGFGDINSVEDFESTVKRTPESEFRTKRCNQWVASSQTWLPHGMWDGLATGEDIPDGAEIVLALDGSFNGDSTALIAVTVPRNGELPHIAVAGAWERPTDAGVDWQVNVMDVEQRIRDWCAKMTVKEVCADPYRWTRSLQLLEGERIPVAMFPQSPQRMTPATQSFYEACANGTVTHSGDAALARHITNAVLQNDSRGQRLRKETKFSNRKIDLAVAAVMGLARATWWANNNTSGVPQIIDPWSMDV
jgi:phage terminase large subunit-like protein